MVVTFVGHRELSDETAVRRWLEKTVQSLILQGADTFFLGGYGRFDLLAAGVVRASKAEHPEIRSYLVIPYLDRNYDVSLYDDTIFPPLESVPRRFAISKRNEYMIQQSNVVVACVLYSFGGAAATLRYAERLRKRIVRFDSSDDR